MRSVIRSFLTILLPFAGMWALALTGAAIAYAVLPPSSPGYARPLKVVVELDPHDSGTAKFHCHFHAETGHSFVFTHCKRGL